MDIIAKLYIDGEIKADNWMANIVGVRDNLSWQRPFDRIQVTLNSCGGDFTEALGMYDEILSHNVPVETHVIGQCCSSATVLFMAGSTRTISENATFMIHQTKGGGWGGSAEEIHNYADVMEGYNERMAGIYAKATGQPDETITQFMSKDTFMTPEECLANGFATAVIKPVVAKATAFISMPVSPPATVTVVATAPTTVPPTTATEESSNQIQNAMKILSTAKARALASITALFDGKQIVAKKVTTDDGTELEIETVDGGDNYAENDPVKLGTENAPDGTYKVGTVTIEVKDGKIAKLTADESAEVVTASADEIPGNESTETSPELTTLQTENATLKTELNDMKIKYGRVEAQMKTILKATESAEVNVSNAGKGKSQNVQAKGQKPETDEEKERREMLEERTNRGKGITPTAA